MEKGSASPTLACSVATKFRDRALQRLRKTFISKDCDETEYEVKLEALLAGHEGWVFSVRWHPTLPVLISASMDRTLMVWAADQASGVWLDTVRVGDIGGNFIQGFFGGMFSPTGCHILGHGFLGAFRLWAHVDAHGGRDLSSSTISNGRWVSVTAATGHFGPVRDMTWDPSGSYLITVSDDQTSRIFASCHDTNTSVSGWYEIARPQVHGYDMRCVVTLTPQLFASGADEKVIRIFGAPDSFIETISTLSSPSSDLHVINLPTASERPLGASIPALGLSNKAVFITEADKVTATSAFATSVGPQGNNEVHPFDLVKLTEPPLEEHLIQNTLWPELQKLYGHGFELATLASNRSGTLLLSSCKATTPEHAVIRVWNTTTWVEMDVLAGHRLTVSCMAFSPSDQWIVSGSRDRQVCIFRSDQGNVMDGRPLYARYQRVEKAHDRIVWDVAWSHDSFFFATGSRDKQVKVWTLSGEDGDKCEMAWTVVSTLPKLPDSVTALDWAPATHGEIYILAVGLNNGSVSVFGCSSPRAGANWLVLHTLNPAVSHTSTVNRLRWRPRCDADTDKENFDYQLATCGADNSVRIIRFSADK